jgi:tetratricopeptide (TPR) repeat protein
MAIAGKCCIKECQTLKKNNDPQLSRRAVALSKKMEMAATILMDANSPIAPATVADTATLQMQYTSSPYRSVLGLIQRGLNSIATNSDENRWRLEALQVEAFVGLGRYQEALDVLRTFNGSNELMVRLILRLNIQEKQKAKASNGEPSDSIAEVEMACFKKLEDISGLPDEKQLAMIQAKNLERLGKASEALTVFRKLASEYSEDGQIQMGYADLLIRQGDIQSRREALRKYREVVRRTPPEKQRWFAAKFGEAKARLLLGDPKKAAQMIRTTQVLYPDLGGQPWRRRFEELLAICIRKENFPDQ